MSTITTKQLRSNMGQVVRDLQHGKSVQLSYRRRVIGILQPVGGPVKAQRRGSADPVREFLATATFGAIPRSLRVSDKSFKQEIAELRDRDLITK